MTDLETIDCANEPNMPGISRVEEWAITDVQEIYRHNNPAEAFLQAVNMRVPVRWQEKKWRRFCVDYLVESYVYHRRVEELADLRICQYIAYRETFEAMYHQMAPKTLIPRSIGERGW